MDFLTCVYCKKRFPATGGLRKNGGLDYCSTSCYYAYNDRKEEREKSERRQLEAEQERTEAVREQTAAARENARLQAVAENNRAAAERQRAEAEKARASAEREKAKAIKEQTEYLKKQHEEDVKKQEQKERLDALNEKCSKRFTSRDGKITYRMGHRPIDEFDCKKSSVFFDKGIAGIRPNIRNTTPNGTGTLKLSLSFCPLDQVGDWAETKKNADGIDEFIHKSSFGGTYEVLLPPLQPGEKLDGAYYEYTLKQSDYIIAPSFCMKLEISEAIGAEDTFKPVFRTTEKFNSPRNIKDQFVKQSSDVITEIKDIKLLYGYYEDTPVFKKGSPSNLEISKVSSLDVFGDDDELSYSVEVKNKDSSTSGSVICFLVCADKDNLEDFTVISVSDRVAYIDAGDSQSFGSRFSDKGSMIVQHRKNPRYVPYAFIAEFNEAHPKQPVLRAAVNLAPTCTYYNKKDISLKQDSNVKQSEGYILFDDDYNAFILDKATGETFDLYSKETGNRTKYSIFLYWGDLVSDSIVKEFSIRDSNILYYNVDKGKKAYEQGMTAMKNKKFEEAFKYFCQADEYGNPDALFEKACALGLGNGVQIDYVRALRLFKISAAQGNRSAQYNVGIYYASGSGCTEDPKKAFEWYLKAAENGHENAMNRVGCYYAEGKGVNKDLAKAKEWLTKALQSGAKDAAASIEKYGSELGGNVLSEQKDKFYTDGLAAKKNKNYKSALDLFSKGANLGNAKCQFQLGELYYYGNGVTKDYAKAVEQYKKAAEQNHAAATYSLGYCYKTGYGITKDIKKAVSYYEKAVELGNADAMNGLGFCYEEGSGVDQDYGKAMELYTKAAEKNHARAQYHIANFYEKGCGVKKNWKTAKEWYEKAAANGDADAKKRLTQPAPSLLDAVIDNSKNALSGGNIEKSIKSLMGSFLKK
ncbi:hypothetical protein [Treponema sp.]|uniref:hypothetical protein n=1 Tax=Treponema sp. TaxID=166 RepID=UPI00298EA9E3|nr:hypothetical protein [Treponema sp.]MCQ2242561.1 hypothetical protein [Treponema sp.]